MSRGRVKARIIHPIAIEVMTRVLMSQHPAFKARDAAATAAKLIAGMMDEGIVVIPEAMTKPDTGDAFGAIGGMLSPLDSLTIDRMFHD